MRLRSAALLVFMALLAREGMAQTQAQARTLLWMWDRPQLFSSLPEATGVAYLHATVRLSGTGSSTSWRQWPLRIAPGAAVVPVVHVALDNLSPSPLDAAQQQAIAAAVEHAAKQGNRSGWVQLDFEARRSQREAYVALLRRLQPLRADGIRLSATALASWCMSDPWLPDGLIDEIVPMYFRMGAEAARIRQRLGTTGAATVPACRDAAGLMLGEEWPALREVKRRYVFHAGSWKNEDFEKLQTTGNRETYK